jgi:hypothetical protein
MSYSDSFPTQRPSLNLVFNGGSDQLDSRISFSRADTPPTYAAPSAVHYWSNEKHLSSLNLTTNSNDLSDWSRVFITRTLSQVGPDGSSNAAKLTGQAGTVFKSIYNATLANTSAQTISFFAKEDTHRYIQVSVNGDATKFVNFDLNGAGAVSANGSGVTASITASGNGYLRCAVNLTLPSTSVYISLQDSLSATREATTASTGSIYIFGAMSTTLGDATNVVAYQSSGSLIHREFAPTLKSVSNAGDPRFEYDPITNNAEGLLIESQSSNLFARSAGFDYTAAWTKTNVTATAEAISPDGTLNAFAIRENTTSGTFKRIHQAATVASGSVAVSVYAKLLGNERRLVIREDSATGDSAVFDLSSGTVAATNVGGAGTIESVGNGWYRCTLITSPSGSPGYQFGFWLATATGTTTESYTGDGYSGLLLFGAMCENASAPSSYVESLASTTTRAADSCSVALSDINFTGGEVTLVADTNTSAIDDYRQAASIIDDSQNQVTLYGNSYNNRLAAILGGGENSTLSQTSANGISALSFGVNDIAATRNGASPVTDTSQAFPDVSAGNLKIGGSGSSQILNGTIKRVALYNVALSDTELQAITS